MRRDAARIDGCHPTLFDEKQRDVEDRRRVRGNEIALQVAEQAGRIDHAGGDEDNRQHRMHGLASFGAFSAKSGHPKQHATNGKTGSAFRFGGSGMRPADR